MSGTNGNQPPTPEIPVPMRGAQMVWEALCREGVDGTLSLCCQRCLETIEYPIQVRSLLEFVDSDDDLTQEELEDDSRDFLPHQKDLDVAALIEDEILLALPTAPRHDDCVLPGASRESAIASPFSVLASLHGKPQ